MPKMASASSPRIAAWAEFNEPKWSLIAKYGKARLSMWMFRPLAELGVESGIVPESKAAKT
ncbi:hypothetical protein B5P46_15600 [Rhizobium leguminosarum]|uniref:Uncharacterized protein n=1 Tax=Rhizobium leguminosarum TaxID=384 RepID=A0A4Q1U1M9_RHILE|nr:hypothetical protein B5P46_15600 [Rhizobium leguminosarum]